MKKQELSLEAGITLYSRVFSRDAGGKHDIEADVMVERFYVPSYRIADKLIDACHFTLVVIREGQIEESIVCHDFPDLQHQLISGVHGGRELAYGDHWSSTPVGENNKEEDA